MNENYLLHNETAKKLYFEYAKDLPIIVLCSDYEPSNEVYNNITEAFLLSDCYKLYAMRDCGIDEKFLTGDASDYEKFKAFCCILPKFAGHPIYLLSHIELKKHFNCDLVICEDNCDVIWQEINKNINQNELNEEKLLIRTNVECFYSFKHSWFDELVTNEEIVDLYSLQNYLINKVESADEKGCKIAYCTTFTDFESPNPYIANKIVKILKPNNCCIDTMDYNLVDMQIARTLGIEYKKLGWTWLLEGSNIDKNVIEYLKDSNALPKIRSYIKFEIGNSEEDLKSQLIEYAKEYPLGHLICMINGGSNTLTYARNEYFRRILCNIIGAWVENGEYTSDEKTLKKLIEDILYNNLKEAIS